MDKYTKINNELVIKSYREFCKNNSLTFSFPAEHSDKNFTPLSPEAFRIETELHNEAMDCFNNLKPKFVVFDGDIYTFRFTNWLGDFDYDVWTVQEFIDKDAKETQNTEVYHQLMIRIFAILSIIVFITVFIIVESISSSLIDKKYSQFTQIIACLVGLVVDTLLYFLLIRIPLKEPENDRERYEKRLSELKKQFVLINQNLKV